MARPLEWQRRQAVGLVHLSRNKPPWVERLLVRHATVLRSDDQRLAAMRATRQGIRTQYDDEILIPVNVVHRSIKVLAQPQKAGASRLPRYIGWCYGDGRMDCV